MSLQKRHYELIARVLADTRPNLGSAARATWQSVVDQFCVLLRQDNLRFSPQWFESACLSGEMARPPSVARRERDRPGFEEARAAWEKKQAEKAKSRANKSQAPDAPEMTLQEVRESLAKLLDETSWLG